MAQRISNRDTARRIKRRHLVEEVTQCDALSTLVIIEFLLTITKEQTTLQAKWRVSHIINASALPAQLKGEKTVHILPPTRAPDTYRHLKQQAMHVPGQLSEQIT